MRALTRRCVRACVYVGQHVSHPGKDAGIADERSTFLEQPHESPGRRHPPRIASTTCRHHLLLLRFLGRPFEPQSALPLRESTCTARLFHSRATRFGREISIGPGCFGGGTTEAAPGWSQRVGIDAAPSTGGRNCNLSGCDARSASS